MARSLCSAGERQSARASSNRATPKRSGHSGSAVARPLPRRAAVSTGMPRISSFYGITIWMYHDEIHHLGRPHFHARYGGDEASVDIESVGVIAGELPPRALRLVGDWALAHQAELRENWARARGHQPLEPIEPLR